MTKDIQFKTHEAREAELNYIRSVDPLNTYATGFNGTRGNFADYCKMQLKSFMQWDNGSFSWYYKDIQDAIDIAQGSKAK